DHREDNRLERAAGEDSEEPAEDDARARQYHLRGEELGRRERPGETGRDEPHPDPLVVGTRVEADGDTRQPLAVARREAVEQRTPPALLTRKRVGTSTPERRLAVPLGRRHQLPDEEERSGETDECKDQQHLEITPSP